MDGATTCPRDDKRQKGHETYRLVTLLATLLNHYEIFLGHLVGHLHAVVGRTRCFIAALMALTSSFICLTP
jgi:hypothetical protein